MIFEYKLITGYFIKRPNRFIAHIDLGGKEVIAHVPNTGRMKELLLPRVEVLVSYHPEPNRKTHYTLRMIKKNGCWVSIDSQLPNQLAVEGIQKGMIKELQGYKEIKRESVYGNSRFDLKLEGDQICYVEVKGVTLEIDGWGYFPDAPTERGRKHVEELCEVVQRGMRGVLLFVVQYEKVQGFSPYEKNDPTFAEVLRMAEKVGVEILVYKCKVEPQGVEIIRELSYKL